MRAAPFRSCARAGLRLAGLRLLRVEVAYTPMVVDRLKDGCCIVACNHVSLLDGVIVALASPVPLAFAVDTDFSRRSQLAMRGLKVLQWLGFGTVVPLDNGAPFGVRALTRVLRAGGNVMVFPEGRISPSGQREAERPGMRWLVERSSADVLAIEIRGAEDSRLFAKSGKRLWPKITLVF